MTDSIDLDESSSHSLNCISDYKDVHCIPQQNIGKISRGDLEDLYYQLHDENIEIKKKFNSLDSKYKIMATRVMRLSKTHKCIESIDREEDQRKLEQFRHNEAALRNKLTVLRGQLASHTRLHSAALSKVQRPQSHRCSRSCHAGHNYSIGDDGSVMDVNCPGNQSHVHNRSRPHSTGRSGSNQRGGIINHKDQNDIAKANVALRDEVANLQDKISVLEKELHTSREQSRAKIRELELELNTHLTQQTAENVELIKSRRLNKQQEAAIISLQQDHQLLKRELQACKAALTLAAKDQDELCTTLMRERQRSSDLQLEIVKLAHSGSSLRDLEEQLNDAKKENAVLKEHSNRLLQLTTGNIETRQSPRISDETNKHEPLAHSALSEANISKEIKIKSLKQQQNNLEEELREIKQEMLELEKKISDAKEVRNSLQDEHVRLQSECSKLRIEMMEPNEEKKKLTCQLAEVQSECNRLVGELSKWKSDLDQKREQFEQVKRLTPIVGDSTEENEKVAPPPKTNSIISPNSNLPLFLKPQLPGHRSQCLPQPLPHSHPSTPRPRIGDACLALLEQTAIRPSQGSFPSVLGSHGSLQERFLELCIPPSSTSSPVPPVSSISSDDGRCSAKTVSVLPNGTLEASAHQLHPSAAESSPKSKTGLRCGQTDTNWELEKCRELLRVQVNLNSIYKKEVASLNNIVQSLTSGTPRES